MNPETGWSVWKNQLNFSFKIVSRLKCFHCEITNETFQSQFERHTFLFVTRRPGEAAESAELHGSAASHSNSSWRSSSRHTKYLHTLNRTRSWKNLVLFKPTAVYRSDGDTTGDVLSAVPVLQRSGGLSRFTWTPRGGRETHLNTSGWMGDSRMRTMTSRGRSRKPPRESSVTWNTFPL